MGLRKHQIEFESIINRIVSGEPIRTVVAHITPGGGKSLFCLLSGRLIKAGLADRIAWVVPRLTLAHQAELNSIDPFFKKMLNHDVTIRSAKNEVNPCRDQTGYVTTFQSLAVDDKSIHSREFLKRRYILIIDETHHAADSDQSWGNALEPMVEQAKYIFLLSGTLSRGDGKRIAFLPYKRQGKIWVLDLQNNENTEVISYNRTDALRERAILPINFTLFDGDVTWKQNGEEISQRLSTATKNSGAAVFTALNTEFAEQILYNGLNHWETYKASHPMSKVAVVCSNIDHANSILSKMKEWGYRAKVATSDDTKSALKAIKLFRGSSLDVMVFVAMCSEGLDIPSLTHIICLTHVRSTPWIEQLVARAVRVDPKAGPYETQMAYIFAPDDLLFRKIVKEIESEQLPFAIERKKKEGKKKESPNEEIPSGIDPLDGAVTDSREVALGRMADQGVFDLPRTIKETEEDILSKIENHVRIFTFQYRYRPGRINAEIKRVFGKPRREMGLKELKKVLAYVKYTYPLNGPGTVEDVSKPRGKGRRVPTRAVPWN